MKKTIVIWPGYDVRFAPISDIRGLDASTRKRTLLIPRIIPIAFPPRGMEQLQSNSGVSF